MPVCKVRCRFRDTVTGKEDAVMLRDEKEDVK